MVFILPFQIHWYHNGAVVFFYLPEFHSLSCTDHHLTFDHNYKMQYYYLYQLICSDLPFHQYYTLNKIFLQGPDYMFNYLPRLELAYTITQDTFNFKVFGSYGAYMYYNHILTKISYIVKEWIAYICLTTKTYIKHMSCLVEWINICWCTVIGLGDPVRKFYLKYNIGGRADHYILAGRDTAKSAITHESNNFFM